jgi:hypothetical protein
VLLLTRISENDYEVIAKKLPQSRKSKRRKKEHKETMAVQEQERIAKEVFLMYGSSKTVRAEQF